MAGAWDTGLSQNEILYRLEVGVAADNRDTDLSLDEILHRILVGVA